MGKMLLKFNCISNEKCNKCYFNKSCIVKKIMSPQLGFYPPFTPKGSTTSLFIIECFDEKTNYYLGDIIEFNMIIFGQAIVYINEIINAFKNLGKSGIASGSKKYNLIGIYNELNYPIYEKEHINKNNLLIFTLQDYINHRKIQINSIDNIRFITPFRFVKNGQLTGEINFTDIVISVYRKLILLNALENIEVEYNIPDIKGDLLTLNSRWVDIKRYSNRQKRGMKFGGVISKFAFSEEINSILDYIIACELVHIGKNTSFGLGKYIINS
ncbi:MAG: CRISPR system precrRNA processing endoribonuclease RAMP protein Cas6 [Clostridium cochlearium]|nr:CRISPR system precrRNA processing endoribonuclease RAMP protein Cas6 [Clostridium cochlearium]MDU1443548.1 CRISPR system precrRNA processing endoribonuclease RAMP protein Cas6 [Clostridium cochlearium]